jgi:hypothetical protein
MDLTACIAAALSVGRQRTLNIVYAGDSLAILGADADFFCIRFFYYKKIIKKKLSRAYGY